jgi:hypothetical protein
MIQVCPNLFVGSDVDYKQIEPFVTMANSDWYVVHACKEPYHRQALGYQTNGAPKDHYEYLIALRDNQVCLNLIDVKDPKFIPDHLVDVACVLIKLRLHDGKKVLVHCNKGESRGPGIAFIYMHRNGLLSKDLTQALDGFQTLYPMFKPAQGIMGYITKTINKEI